MEILYAFSIIIIITTATWLHAYHRKMFAQARLDISKVILEMDKLMVSGEITAGNICHDHIYERMLQSQRARRYDINWRPWNTKRPIEELKSFVKDMHCELERHPKVASLFAQYIRSDFCAFKNNRPFMAIVFAIWIAFCFVGFSVVLKSLFTYLWAKESWNTFKVTVAEFYSKLGLRIA